MQYWVRMTEDELRVALLLFGQIGLEGVTELRRDFEPSPALLEGMLRKGFFEEENAARRWTPFVEAVLRCALQSQSQLRLHSSDGTLCGLYFRYDNMVLLSRKPDDEAMTLFFVPLLPEAIGTLARELKTEELASCRPAPIEEKKEELSLPDGGEAAVLLPALRAARPDAVAADAEPLLLADGTRFGAHTLAAALLRTEGGSLRLAAEGDALHIAPAGYYDFLESVSHWIVAAHGASIAAKEGGA